MSSKTRRKLYKILTKTIPMLTPNICKLFFQIVAKFFRGTDGSIVSIQNIRSYFLFLNDNKIMFIVCIYQNIFEKVDLPEGGVSSFDVTLIAYDAI
eukprot:UN28314